MNLNKYLISIILLFIMTIAGWYAYFLESKHSEKLSNALINNKIENVVDTSDVDFSHWYVVYTRTDGSNYSYGMKAIRLSGSEFSYVKAAEIITLEHETYGVNLFFVNVVRITQNAYYEYLYEKGSAIHHIEAINSLGNINKNLRDSLLNINN